jgi:hypothetical protein
VSVETNVAVVRKEIKQFKRERERERKAHCLWPEMKHDDDVTAAAAAALSIYSIFASPSLFVRKHVSRLVEILCAKKMKILLDSICSGGWRGIFTIIIVHACI